MQTGVAGSDRHLERYILTGLLTGLAAIFMLNFAFLTWQLTGQPVFAWTLAIATTALFGLRLHMTAIADRDVRTPITWRDWVAFTLPTLAVIRILSGAFVGFDIGTDPLAILGALGGLVFSIESLLLLGLLSASWAIAASMAASINSLCYRENSQPPPRDTAAFYVWQAARALTIDRGKAVDNIRIAALAAAVMLAIIAAGLILLPAAIGGKDTQLVPAFLQLPALFSYYLLMFITLSYVSYTRNLSTWSEAGTQVSDSIASVWLRTSALVIGLGLLLASFLPVFLIPNMEYFGGYLLKGVVLIWQLVTLPVFLALALGSYLFGLLFSGVDDALVSESAGGEMQMFGQSIDSITLVYLQGIFAAVLLMAALFWLYRRSFASGRPGKDSRYRQLLSRLLAFLWRLLAGLALAPFVLGRAAARAATASLAARNQTRTSTRQRRPQSNLDLLWQAFNQVIAHAERADLTRLGDQTAREFGARLVSQLGIETTLVQSAADQFTRARYDPDQVTSQAVERMRSLAHSICSQIDEGSGAGRAH